MNSSLWAIEIPRNLSKDDQINVTRMLGLNTSSKILTNPFPLGGYPGLEIGISLEIINTTDLSRYGDTSDAQKELRYPRISFGKGLYNNVDVFFHFIPFDDSNRLSEYGGQVRWSFYQAKFLPINMSLIGHGNIINFGDSFTSRTLGTDLITGINVNNFSLYFGGGFLAADAKFQGGTSGTGVVPPGSTNSADNTANLIVRDSHAIVGVTIHFHDLFLAGQIDRYREPVYSLKLGTRF